MAIAYNIQLVNAIAKASGAAATVDLTGITIGDMLVVYAGARTGATTFTFSGTGYNSQAGGDSSENVWTKKVDGTEGSSLTITPSSGLIMAQAFTIRVAGATWATGDNVPITTATANTNLSTAVCRVTAVTPSSSNSVIVATMKRAIGTINQTATTFTPSTNFTNTDGVTALFGIYNTTNTSLAILAQVRTGDTSTTASGTDDLTPTGGTFSDTSTNAHNRATIVLKATGAVGLLNQFRRASMAGGMGNELTGGMRG